MHNSTILEILRTFNENEIKIFEEFLSSPYFNKQTAVVKLYKQIKKYAPEFSSPRLNKEKVWEAIYKNKQYNYGLFKNYIYDLTKLAEKFVMYESIKKENLHSQFSFLESLFDRQINDLFESKFNSLNKKINQLHKNSDIEAKDKFEFLSKIYLLKSNFSDLFSRHSSIGDEFKQHSVFRISLLLYSVLETSINAVNLSLKNFYDKDNDPVLLFVRKADSENLINELLNILKKEQTGNYEIINVYYKYYLSISDNDSIEKYLDFKDALVRNAPGFSKPDQHNLYSGLRNTVVNLASPEINKGKEFLDITKLMMKDDLVISKDGIMNEITFVSEIQTACSLGDAEFIEEFTDKFVRHLPKASRDNMKKFAMAHLYFARNEFERSLEQMLTIRYDLFGVKFYLKNLQMMIYYEFNDYDSFVLLLDSYRHFLNNNRSVTEDWRKTQAVLLRFLTRLFNLKGNYDEFEMKRLKQDISSSIVLKKQWLLRKIEELETS